nr:hypothetical protein [Tanacetum cinerariifolium]
MNQQGNLQSQMKELVLHQRFRIRKKDKSQAQDDLDDWGSTDDETFLFDDKDEKVEDIPWVFTNEDESDDDEEEDDASVDIEKTDDEKTDTDIVDRFLNSPNVSLIGTIQENAKAEINSLLDIQIQQDVSNIQQEPFHAVKVHTQKVLQRHTEELKQEFSQKTIHQTHTKELHQQVSKDDVSKFIKVKQELATKEKMSKYSTTPYDQASKDEHKQKDILFQMMMASKSHEKNPAHKELYDALIQSLLVDENDMDMLVVDPASQRKRRHDDKDQDPPAGSEQGMKKRRTGKDVEPSKRSLKSKESAKGKTPSNTSKTGKSIYAEKSSHEPEHVVQMDVKEPNLDNPPLMFDELMRTLIDFFAFAMNRLKLNKITRADLVDLVFNLLKGSSKRQYSSSITKILVARYTLEGIEDMIPTLWSPFTISYDKDDALGISHQGP